VHLASVREEEEGGWLGLEVSWAGREAEAQWGGGDGQLERKKRAAAGPKVRMGRLAAGPVGPKVRKILFRIKFDFFNIPRLWKFAQGDLGGILTRVFFLNSSRLLKYFRKMKYVMSCYATLGKIN
jgi:hypothetical protein